VCKVESVERKREVQKSICSRFFVYVPFRRSEHRPEHPQMSSAMANDTNIDTADATLTESLQTHVDQAVAKVPVGHETVDATREANDLGNVAHAQEAPSEMVRATKKRKHEAYPKVAWVKTLVSESEYVTQHHYEAYYKTKGAKKWKNLFTTSPYDILSQFEQPIYTFFRHTLKKEAFGLEYQELTSVSTNGRKSIYIANDCFYSTIENAKGALASSFIARHASPNGSYSLSFLPFKEFMTVEEISVIQEDIAEFLSMVASHNSHNMEDLTTPKPDFYDAFERVKSHGQVFDSYDQLP